MSEEAAISAPEIVGEQLVLLDARSRPMRNDLVQMVKARSYVHTGKLLSKDEELCRAVCRDLVAGLSGRKVAKKYGVSRNSVLAIEHAMRARGELEPLKKETARLLDEFIYLGLERITEAVAEDEISPGQLPIPIMAAIDKKGQLEAGMVPGTDRTVAEVTAEQVQAAFEAMKRARVLAIETTSDANTVEPQQTLAIAAQDTALDTTPPAPASPDQGGGGSSAGEAPPVADGKANPEFEPKEPV